MLILAKAVEPWHLQRNKSVGNSSFTNTMIAYSLPCKMVPKREANKATWNTDTSLNGNS